MRIKDILPLDKYIIFKKLLTFPLATTAIVDTIKDHYSKVYEAKDAFFNIKCSNEESKYSFLNLLGELNEDAFWKDKALDAICDTPSMVLVCDKPTVDPTGQYKPYFIQLQVEDIIDIDADAENNIKYLIYKAIDKDTGDLFIAAIDDNFYYRIEDDSTKPNDERYTILSSVVHDCGYTPARFLGNEPLFSKTTVVQKSPLSPVLGMFDEYLAQYVFKRHLGLYSAYPIYWTYDLGDDNESEFNELAFKDWVGETYEAYSELEVLALRKQYQSKNAINELMGPGTIVQVPTPLSKEDADLKNPIGAISPDLESLKFNTGNLDAEEKRIINYATGKVGRDSKLDRTNELAVSTQSEGERDVLIYVSNQLSKTRTWLWATLGKMYLPTTFQNCTYSYGTEFFIEDEAAALANFKLYKDSGASTTMLHHRHTSFRQVSTKNLHPNTQLRLSILESIEPYPMRSVEEVESSFLSGVIDGKDLDIKLRFIEYVARFEREEGIRVEDFEKSDKNFNEWIEYIKNKVSGYGKTITRDNIGSTSQSVGSDRTINAK